MPLVLFYILRNQQIMVPSKNKNGVSIRQRNGSQQANKHQINKTILLPEEISIHPTTAVQPASLYQYMAQQKLSYKSIQARVTTLQQLSQSLNHKLDVFTSYETSQMLQAVKLTAPMPSDTRQPISATMLARLVQATPKMPYHM